MNGQLLLQSGKVSDAFNLLQQAAKDSPNSLPIKLLLGQAAHAKGDIAVAEQSYRDATRINPSDLAAQKGLAQIANEQHDFNLLQQVAEATLAKYPDLPDPYIWRGLVEINEKQPDKAEADFRAAIKKDPKNSVAYVDLGVLSLSQKHIPEGRAWLEQALLYDPNNPYALHLLVAGDMYDKQPAKALARIQKQLAITPQNSNLYDELADVQLSTKDTAGALASAQKAMQLNSSDGNAVILYARAQVTSGNIGPAIGTWQQWIKAHPNDAQAESILGTLEESQGDTQDASDAYKKALKIQPEQGVAANNLAFLMIEGGENIDVALSLAQTARRSMPNSPNTADTLAWAYYHKGTYAYARDLLEEALKTSPNDAAIQYHLGMTYSKLGDKANMALHLKKAIALAPNTQTERDATKALNGLG